MHHRHTLVAVSLSVHVAAVLGLFVAGFWKLDRLDAPRRTIDLAVAPPPPPAPSGSPAAGEHQPFKKKKPRVIAKEVTQPPVEKDPETTPVETTTEPTTGTGGTGTGAGSGSGTDPRGTGDCVGDHCGTSEQKQDEKKEEVIEDEKPEMVIPQVIRGMRTSGETQIQPPDIEKTALMRTGKPRATATVKVCVSDTGAVTSLAMFKGSGYAGWDAAILRAMRAWRYKPHRIGKRAVPVCGMVTFLYEIR